MELIVATDAEQAVIDALTPHFPTGTGIPNPLVPAFFRVVRVGGIERDLVTDSPLLTLESFHARESVASENLSFALAVLQAQARAGAIGGKTCYRLQIASLPQNLKLPSVPTHARYISTIAPDLRRRVTTL